MKPLPPVIGRASTGETDGKCNEGAKTPSGPTARLSNDRREVRLASRRHEIGFQRDRRGMLLGRLGPGRFSAFAILIHFAQSRVRPARF
jgi:hypothetical protein